MANRILGQLHGVDGIQELVVNEVDIMAEIKSVHVVGSGWAGTFSLHAVKKWETPWAGNIITSITTVTSGSDEVVNDVITLGSEEKLVVNLSTSNLCVTAFGDQKSITQL